MGWAEEAATRVWVPPSSSEDDDDDDEASASSGSDGQSDTSGLLVRIKQKAASADEDEAAFLRRYGQERAFGRSVRLAPSAGRSRDLAVASGKALPGGGTGARRAAGGSTARLPRTTYMTLYPGQPDAAPGRSDDDTRSLPDLPSLKASLPALRTSPSRRKRPSLPFIGRAQRPSALVWRDLQEPPRAPSPPRDIKLSYRYYDFRRLTRPRKRRHKRRAKSRSPSRSRPPRRKATHNAHAHNPGPAGATPSANPGSSSRRPRPRKRAPRAAPHAAHGPTPLRDGGREAEAPRPPPAPRGVRMIDVNQLTIGGYRENPMARWQATPRRPQPPIMPPNSHLATTPPLLRRFLDPRAPLF